MGTSTLLNFNNPETRKNINEKLYYQSTGFNAALYLLLFAVIIYNSTSNIFSQTPGQWTWVSGDTTNNSAAVYGNKGVSSSSAHPQGLYEPVEWTDLNGNFWLYGGGGVSSNLWKFDPVINEWTWVMGPGNVFFEYPVYGNKGVSSSANTPGSRGFGTPSWTDNNGDLWLFSGGQNSGSDLWKYNISANQWTWVHGDSTFGSYLPIFGTKGVPSTATTPYHIGETSAAWADDNGRLWMYGGSDGGGAFGDLWRYDISTDEWTWMTGSGIVNQPAFFGNKGVAAASNDPGGRWAYGKWKDTDGNLWMFGGNQVDSSTGGPIEFNDVWKFEIASNEWTWMDGDSLGGSQSTWRYGNICDYDTVNLPPARTEGRACWGDACGNFWMYSGWLMYADLWYYNIDSLQWKIITVDTNDFTYAEAGAKGVSAPNYNPGSLGGAVGWTDANGYLWLFGGMRGTGEENGAMWRFVPDSSCTPRCGQVCSVTADAGNNQTILNGDSVKLSASGGVFFSWSPLIGLSCTTCNNPVAKPTVTTLYYVTVSKNDTCLAVDSVIVMVDTIAFPCTAENFVPSAFSPNGDYENEILYVYGKCISEMTFSVYDRWGNKVFETNDLTAGWDGTYKGRAMDAAVFDFHFSASLRNGEMIEKRGNISLVR